VRVILLRTTEGERGEEERGWGGGEGEGERERERERERETVGGGLTRGTERTIEREENTRGEGRAEDARGGRDVYSPPRRAVVPPSSFLRCRALLTKLFRDRGKKGSGEEREEEEKETRIAGTSQGERKTGE
jgi:hypothetical protein